MLTDLRTLVQRHESLEAEDLVRAARQLLDAQFLYAGGRGQRDAYTLVSSHFGYFSDLFAALGWTLYRDPDFDFLGLLPAEDESCLALKQDESALLLVARLLFEEGLEQFQAQHGTVWVDGETWLERYETLLRRERPKRTRFMEIVALFVRHGLAERGETDPASGLPRLGLRPAIRLVTPERSLVRLEQMLGLDEEDATDPAESGT